MKDVLIDNCVAKNFCNPMDPEYRRFIAWLASEGVVVVTQSLLVEYHRSTGASNSPTNIVVILNKLMAEGRFRKIGKRELDALKIPSHIRRNWSCNVEDHVNVKAVVLSVRKYALSLDDRFRADVNAFPGVGARAERRPQDLPYSA